MLIVRVNKVESLDGGTVRVHVHVLQRVWKVNGVLIRLPIQQTDYEWTGNGVFIAGRLEALLIRPYIDVLFYLSKRDSGKVNLDFIKSADEVDLRNLELANALAHKLDVLEKGRFSFVPNESEFLN
jgi:hypothetical protein